MGDLSRNNYRSEEFITRAMDEWGGSVFRLAFAYTTSRVDAEDIYQEVFIRLFKDATEFRDSEHLKAWLLRVTINCCHDLARSGWRNNVVTVDELESFTGEYDTLSLQAMDDLTAALDKLPKDMRTVIHLYYYEGYTSAEIAQLLEINASTIRTRLERARKELKTLLGGAKYGSNEYLSR